MHSHNNLGKGPMGISWAGLISKQRGAGKTNKQIISESTDFPAAYFRGLHYLITNQYDKATESLTEAVKADQNSIEIHFALGNLLRRTGKLDKAISLHIDLLENREMSVNQKESVQAELAQDYFNAGLFDRSEEILLSLSNDSYKKFKLNTLLEIYVKEREWEKAIKIAEQLDKNSYFELFQQNPD